MRQVFPGSLYDISSNKSIGRYACTELIHFLGAIYPVSRFLLETSKEMQLYSSVGKLLKHHTKCQDTYLKYIQFRTLYKRFYTNDKLSKLGLKTSN